MSAAADTIRVVIPLTIRKRNVIAKKKLPYRTASGLLYDSGDFSGNMTKMVEASDWKRDAFWNAARLRLGHRATTFAARLAPHNRTASPWAWLVSVPNLLHLLNTLAQDPTAHPDLPAIAAAVDDPVADYAIVPTWKLAAEAARDLKVVLCGEGGDELFAGYDPFKALAAARRTCATVIPASTGCTNFSFCTRSQYGPSRAPSPPGRNGRQRSVKNSSGSRRKRRNCAPGIHECGPGARWSASSSVIVMASF